MLLLYLALMYHGDSELLMDETRSCINGYHIQDEEFYCFDVTEQMSLGRSTVAALAVPLRYLQKQDLSTFDSANSSGLLADGVFVVFQFLTMVGQISLF